MYRYSRIFYGILRGRRHYGSGKGKWHVETQEMDGNADKTFDALNSSNVDTMYRILGILDSEASEVTPESRFGRGMRHLARGGGSRRTDTKTISTHSESNANVNVNVNVNASANANDEHDIYNNSFSTEFGRNVFKYELYNFLNRNNILAVHKVTESNYPYSYDSMYAQFSKSFGSYSRTPFHALARQFGFDNAYQTLTQSFVTEDRMKYRSMVDKSLLLMANLHGLPIMNSKERESFQYNFPMLYIPPAHMRGGGEFDILTLNETFLMQEDELNLLPFILDNELPGKTIERWQAANHKTSSFGGGKLIKKLCDAMNVEGELAFSCFVKKIFYKLEPDDTNILIMNEIQNYARGSKPNDRIKAIIAYKSRILRRAIKIRMLSYRILEMNVELMPDRTIEQYLARSFNRYFAVFVRTNPTAAERWLTDIILNYSYQDLTTESLYQAALTDFRDMEFDAINSISIDTWREDGKAFMY